MFLMGFDTETTGVNFLESQVIQVGAVMCDVHLNVITQAEWNINFDPFNYEWTREAENVHGIPKDVAQRHGVPVDNFVNLFHKWMEKYTGLKTQKEFEDSVYIVGANCQFDYNMCKYSLFDRYEGDEKSFIPFSYRILYDVNALGNFVVEKNSLGSLMRHFKIPVDNSRRHSALYDAQKHIEVFRSILLADIARCKG